MPAAVRPNALRNLRALAWAGLYAASSAGTVAASSLSLRTLADEPGRLVVEASVPEAGLSRVGSEGWRAGCAGCHRAGFPGGPDLPFASLQILASGPDPRVTVSIVESGTRALPEGMAPEPAYPTPAMAVYLRDPALWQASAAGAATVGPPRMLRGRTLRPIRIPLARWSESARILTLIRKAVITVEYPALAGCGGTVPVDLAAEVSNPRGGACGFAPAPDRALAKSRRQAVPPLGDSLVRIDIGDSDPGSFGEDRVYAVPFEAFIRLAPTAAGVPMASLRMYAGPADTLRTIPSGPPTAGTLRQIPLEPRDRNGNGIFDGGDSVLFYGRGSSVWKRLPAASGPIRFAFSGDPASRQSSYWLDFSGRDPDPALRLAPVPAEARAAEVRAHSRHYLRAERDQIIMACDRTETEPRVDSASGSFWFWLMAGACGNERARKVSGSQLATPETEFPEHAARQPGDSLYVGMFAHPYEAEDDFTLRLEGGSRDLPLIATGTQGNWYVTTDPLPEGRFRFATVDWRGEDSRFEGYTLAYRRRLESSGKPLRIFPEAPGGRVSYRVQGAAGAACVRVEDGVAVKRMTLDGEGVFTDSIAAGADATWLVYGAASVPEASSMRLERPGAAQGVIRDLASADGAAPEYLILAPEAFAAEAVALAKYRADPARATPLRTSVALAEDVYRRYSGGRACAAALRDFIRWGHSTWTKGGDRSLRYVLLLGDGHYDALGIRSASRGETARNRLPVFEWIAGNDDLGPGLAGDDYYGLLDSGEAAGSRGAMLELALGRIPANSAVQARDYLAKIKAWEDASKAGPWRSRSTFAADDGIQKGGALGDVDKIKRGHTTDSDSLARLIESRRPGMAADKVYMVDYPLNAAWHKPEAARDLLSFINDGTTLVNYVGHGSHNQWADEVLLQSNDGLVRMRNQGRTPMINAFSCTVGRFDDFANVGLSELFVTAPGKGAIAAVSATRVSFAYQNIDLARSFYGHLFPPPGAPPMPVGEALRLAKNDPGLSYDMDNSSRYSLLGEPVMLLRKPELAISLESPPDTLRALDCGSFHGKVQGGSGSGFVNIRVLSQSQPRSWGPPFRDSSISVQHALMRGNVLFEGTFPYADGRFDAGYFMPAQIAFGDTNARILAYAWDAKKEAEGSAAQAGIAIHGTSTGACAVDADGRGPRIRISGCDGAVDGGVDFPDQVRLPLPYCLEVTVEDSSGGVLSSDGPDDGTVFEIPGSLAPYHPRPGIDEVFRKVYRLPLERNLLGTGARLFKVLARDGYGNRSLRTLKMDLTQDSSLQTVSAYNVPNPVRRNGTAFYFSTLVPAAAVDYGDPAGGGASVDFEVRVFDQAGRMVRRFAGARSGETRWDGRDAWGNAMGNGVYFYQVTARQNQGEARYKTLSSRRNTLILSR